MRVVISFSLDSVRDADILRWLDGLPRRRRSEAIRLALRAHVSSGSGVSLGDVYQAIRDLERRLDRVVVRVVHAEQDDDEWEEPPDAAAALDALAKLT